MIPGFATLAPQAIGPRGWYFVAFHAVLIPWMAWRSRHRAKAMSALPPRSSYFTSTILIQGLLYVLAIVVARAYHIALYPAQWPRVTDWGWGLAALAAMLIYMWPRWRRAAATHERRLHFFMPRGAGEKSLWTGVSAAAAINEEATYRGVLYSLLLILTGAWWAAALLAAVIFGLAHAFQSRQSMVIIFVFALVFQGLVLVSGALYVAMAVHFVYDVIAGLRYSQLGRELGYPAVDSPTDATAPDPGAAPTAAPSSSL
jgi:membrane protease YdiL (CAAX protease family)